MFSVCFKLSYRTLAALDLPSINETWQSKGPYILSLYWQLQCSKQIAWKCKMSYLYCQYYDIRQAEILDCSTTTLTTLCQHVLLLLAGQKLLHRTWRVLSFSLATIFIHLHQMSHIAPYSAENLVVFEDNSLSTFCFSCPTPHEAGKGPVVCFWHDHTSNWDLILPYNQCTWTCREGHLLCW